MFKNSSLFLLLIVAITTAVSQRTVLGQNVRNDIPGVGYERLLSKWGEFGRSETFIELVHEQVGDSFGRLARDPERYEVSARQIERMVAELQERIKENEIPIESKMEEVKRKVIARSKFAGEKCVCTIFESKNDQGERIVAAKVFKVGKVVKRFDEKLVTLGLIAGEQRVEDVPMSITEFDEWKEWDAYQDQELVNYRFLGSEKYKILKANLSSASFDKLIGEFAGEAGVNVLASPLLRERLQISRSQGTKLDEIFREGELEVQNLTDQWHDMIKADVARTRLEDFIRNSVKWRLEIQDRLLKVLTKKQLAEVNTWYAASKQFPDPLFMIPSDYGEGGEGYYERQELMMDMFRTLEKSKKNTKPAPALSPAIPWNYHGVRWFE